MAERRNVDRETVVIRPSGATILHRINVLLRDWPWHPRILSGTSQARMLRPSVASR
jgi:hypothetical protein